MKLRLRQLKELLRKAFNVIVWENRGIFLSILFLLLIAVVSIIFVLAPAYKDSKTKFYGSGLGYPAALRKLGKPLPVEVAKVQEKEFLNFIMGEGNCASDPFLIPIVPMAHVTHIGVEEGDIVKEGQLVAKLDDTKAQIKFESAKLAVSTAEAELQRVLLGSAYVLAQERPKVEQINFEAQEKLTNNTLTKLKKYQKAYELGVVSETALVEVEGEYTDAKRALDQIALQKETALGGVEQSKLIAQNAVQDAKEALTHRSEELEDFTISSPVEGIVERVLINAGEYNQDSGKPGFLIASGLWFEGYFDQSDFPKIKKGMEAKVYLESFPGAPFKAKVQKIVPIVTFSQGGPEIQRPLRPRGTGSPEWAATFKVRLELEENNAFITPGMTGFARLELNTKGLAIPRAALTSISAGSGFVYLIEDGKAVPRAVQVGIVMRDRVEILSGLNKEDEVITEGFWNLKESDEVEIQKTWDW